MVTSMLDDNKAGGTISYGIMSGIDEVPKDFSVEFALYYSKNGINKVKFKTFNSFILFYKLNLFKGYGRMGRSDAQVLW